MALGLHRTSEIPPVCIPYGEKDPKEKEAKSVVLFYIVR